MTTLVPKPNGPVTMEKTTVSLPKALTVDLEGMEAWCLTAFLERTGRTLTEGSPWLRLSRDEKMPREGYRLEVTPSGTAITAAGEAGVILALTSLFQLLEADTVPLCRIEDAPRYAHRGLSLDCARHFFPVSVVKQVIEELSQVKMNILHWHLTDDQGWRIESKVFPRLHETSGQYYTQEEIRDIMEYARNRGVEIIPEVDLPGHSGGILAAYPKLSCFEEEIPLADCASINPVSLCAGKEDTFSFLERLLDEICPLFPSDRFHIGGDEAPKSRWNKCPRCQARMEREGIATTEDLQGYFTLRVGKLLEKHGKRMVFWNDTLRAGNLPENVLAQYWTMQHLEAMERYTGEFVYSEMFDLYLDYPHSLNCLKKVYSCKAKVGKTNREDDPRLLGLEACLWSEHIETPEKLWQKLFPRIYALAENGWTRKKNYADFKKRLTPVLARAAKNGVGCTEESWWDPRGKARREDGLAFLAMMTAGLTDDVKEDVLGDTQSSAMMLAFLLKFFRLTDLPFILGKRKM